MKNLRVLLSGLVLLALAVGPQPATAAARRTGSYPAVRSFNFDLDIPRCAAAEKNIREIHIDELNIDAREMTTGLDVEYRLYGPGHAHWGSASFTSAVTLGGSKELQAWWQECASGKNIRKTQFSKGGDSGSFLKAW